VTQTQATEAGAAGASLPDEHGHFGPYGGQFVAETLMLPLEELTAAYWRYIMAPEFRAELDADLAHYVGRPSPLYHAERLSREWWSAHLPQAGGS
jgi:tryptophan synthase beta chain